MWRTVLILALLTANDPVRLGITALLVSRPRPLPNLFAFWLGGVASGIAAGVAVLLTMRDYLPSAIHRVTQTIASVTHGPVQITLGALVLLFAARLAIKLRAPQAQQIAMPVGAPLSLAPRPADPVSSPTLFSRLSAGAKQALDGGNLWVAFVAGLGSATPPIEYLIALAAILASGAAAGSQVGAVVMFVVVVLAVVEIPLLSCLASPAKTQAVMMYLHNFLRDRRRVITAATMGVGGFMLMAGGIATF